MAALCWFASPAGRRLLGVRHPVSQRLGVFLFLPFGLGTSPARNDNCAKEVLRLAPPARPSFRIIDSLGDLRLAEVDGSQGRSFIDMARFMEVLTRSGVRLHPRAGKRCWPTLPIPSFGFLVTH